MTWECLGTAPTSDPAGQQEKEEASGDRESEWRADGRVGVSLRSHRRQGEGEKGERSREEDRRE